MGRRVRALGPGEFPLIDEVEMSVRLANALWQSGVKTIDELAALTANELLRLKNVGRQSVREARGLLAARGMTLKGETMPKLPGMTQEDLSMMTLADFEVMAERLEKAARTIRDAMELLHGGTQAVLPQGPALPPQPVFQPITPRSPTLLTPEREEYMRELRSDPQRAALLAQFAKDGEPVEAAPTQRIQVDHFGGGS